MYPIGGMLVTQTKSGPDNTTQLQRFKVTPRELGRDEDMDARSEKS